MSKKILVVDDEPNNLNVLKQILQPFYQLFFARNGAKALEAALTHQPDLILLDIMMPELDGYAVCYRLKANPLTSHIPVIFVSALHEVEDQSIGFDVGAVDFITKPVDAPLVLRRVQTHLSLVRVQELEKSYKEAVFMLGHAGHYNDADSGMHIFRMASYARLLAKAAGWANSLADRLELAAMMHDTGKIGVPNTLLRSQDTFTPAERAVMQTHAQIGFEILSKCSSPIFTLAAEIALYHHERWDGAGYPKGLAGLDIPESARITAIADVFDALTMDRPYRPAWSVDAAMQMMLDEAGKHFDPRLMILFEKILPQILEQQAKWTKKE